MNPVRGGSRRFSAREAAGYAVIGVAVWLAWEVVKVPVAVRAPPELAIRLAPTSPEVLRRAAESEMRAERNDNALALANESLARAPFNARALRVRGLAEANAGRADQANELLTLAGNWSLRDDPSHAWLIEHRLRRGDYNSAFAHADTLARRRDDLYPSLFRLFATAAAQDQRAGPVLVRLLAETPPWRSAFLAYLNEADEGPAVAGGLAISLQQTKAPLTNIELQNLYRSWLAEGRVPGVEALRTRLNRPASNSLLINGDFSTDLDDQIQPFGWRLGAAPGLSSNIVEDDLRADNLAYRLEYDGFGAGVFTEQFLLLKPGSYVITGETRTDTPENPPRVGWTLRCVDGAAAQVTGPNPSSPIGPDWASFQVRVEIPAQNCTAQWLLLTAQPEDRRTTIIVWIDNLRLQAAR